MQMDRPPRKNGRVDMDDLEKVSIRYFFAFKYLN